MAARKNQEPPEEELIQAEGTVSEAAENPPEEAKPASAWDEEMTIFVPRRAKGDDQTYVVIVNDRICNVPANGRAQTLPKPIALILQNAIDAEAAAQDYSEQVTMQAMSNAAKLV